MRNAVRLFSIAMSGVLLGCPAAAIASEQIFVQMDKSKFLKLDTEPGTVVVGNPSIADVTLSGNLMFLHARGYGNTNIIVLDRAGNELAEYNVNVVQDDPYAVSVFKGGKRESYNCVDECQPTMQIGDDAAFFTAAGGQITNKNAVAQGQQMGETTSAGSPDNGSGQGQGGSPAPGSEGAAQP